MSKKTLAGVQESKHLFKYHRFELEYMDSLSMSIGAYY